MSEYLDRAIEEAPEGTSGRVVAPWAQHEVYGVAADWGQASAPVYFYGKDGWQSRQYQVADFRHTAINALQLELEEAIIASGDDPNDGDDNTNVDFLLNNAIEFCKR